MESVLAEVEVVGRVLAEGPAGSEQPERSEHDEHADTDEGPAPSEAATSGHLTVERYIGMVDVQHRHVGSLEERDHPEGERELDETGHREMGERHGRDGLGEVERRVQRRAIGGLEQIRLDAELDRCAHRRDVQPGVRSDAGGQRSTRTDDERWRLSARYTP